MTETMSDFETDRRLLETIVAYVDGCADTLPARFRDAFEDAARDWRAVATRTLPAADILGSASSLSGGRERNVVDAFARARTALRWEQSYTKADGVVGDDMLAAYGFAEITGKLGPFVSERVRSGIGVWGPGIAYPLHRHRAEEVYVVLAGGAAFTLDGRAPVWRRTGEAVHVPSMTRHGFRTGEDPVVVFYIWQNGDLREISQFEGGESWAGSIQDPGP